MNPQKIENFKRLYRHEPFPAFRSLLSEETTAIRKRLLWRLGSDAEASDLVLTRLLWGISMPIDGVNAEEDGFDLREVLHDRGIVTPHLILVDWYRFDDIDEIALGDLSKWFDHIWYPGADDVEVFDSTLDWVMVVRHDGVVGLAKP